jgi:DNA-binding SARP family transcriptional activator
MAMHKSRVADGIKVVPLEAGRHIDTRHRHPGIRPIVRVHLLGAMRATSYLGESILPRGRKARAILGYLCQSVGEQIPRARLAGMLWDRVGEPQARASFRQALRELTAAMGPLAHELISTDRDTIRLSVGLCWIDAVALLNGDAPPTDLSHGDLASLCKGELLEEFDSVSTSFDHWLLAQRTQFNHRMRSRLETALHELNASDGDPREVASVARQVISFDPTNESASRILMHALAKMGERAESLREFSRCRDALRRTLDVEPSPETHALYAAVRSFPLHDDRSVPATSARPVHHGEPQQRFGGAARDRFRVGVLPFLATRSLNEETLAFSLSQEVAAGLARFRWFDVIAPVSLMRRPSAGMLSEDLLRRKELDYVVDGALSGNGSCYQVSVRLLDLADYARPIWSDRVELAIGELHRLNELVTTRIVGRIDPVILFMEGQPRRRESYGATGLLLLAMPLIYSMERSKYEEARQLIDRALEIEPNNAMVNAWAAYWHVFYVGQGWCQGVGQAFQIAQDHALKAIKLDPENAEALGIYAHICSFFNKDFDSAIHYFDRALRLNPSLAFIWALSSATYCYVGDPDAALQRLDRYRDLAPFDPYFSWFENFYTIAYTFKGDYEQAVVVGNRVTRVNPDFSNGYKPLIAALGHLGRLDEAKVYVTKLLALEPRFTVERFARTYPIRRASDLERYVTGLRLAGVPEA